MVNLAVLRATVFSLSAKNRTGGVEINPPPPVRGLRTLQACTGHCLWKKMIGGAQLVIGGALGTIGGVRAPPKRYEVPPVIRGVADGGVAGGQNPRTSAGDDPYKFRYLDLGSEWISPYCEGGSMIPVDLSANFKALKVVSMIRSG